MRIVELKNPESFEEIAQHIELLYIELFGEEARPTHDTLQQIKRQWLESPINHQAFKLVQNNRTLAFFTLVESFSFFARGHYGVINELWVCPSVRSSGVGRKVLDYVKEIAVERGWKRIDVTAPESEKWARSFAFYQKNGFVATGKKLKYTVVN